MVSQQDPSPVAGMSVQPTTLNFTTTPGSFAESQPLVITNTGSKTLDWTAVVDSTFVVITPTSGSLDPTVSTVMMVTATLPSPGQSITTSITIECSDPTVQVQQITVTITSDGQTKPSQVPS